MKYKAGDKIKIRPYEDLIEHMLMNSIKVPFSEAMENTLKRLDSQRIVTIKAITTLGIMSSCGEVYIMEEDRGSFSWADWMIECEVTPLNPIENRFEILDL